MIWLRIKYGRAQSTGNTHAPPFQVSENQKMIFQGTRLLAKHYD